MLHSRKFSRALAVFLMALAPCALFAAEPAAEETYQGRTFAQWAALLRADLDKLNDRDSRDFRDAADALLHFRTRKEDAATALVAAVVGNHQVPEALDALVSCGPAGAQALESLANRQSLPRAVRFSAAMELARYDGRRSALDTMAALAENLGDKYLVADGFVSIGDHARAKELLREVLDAGPNGGSLTPSAAMLLMRLSPDDREARERLERLMRAPYQPNFAAVDALHSIFPSHPLLTASLVERLATPDEEMRVEVADKLWQIAPAHPAIPFALLSTFGDDNPPDRALELLAAIAPRHPCLHRAVRRRLESDESEWNDVHALKAIEFMREEAAPFAELLVTRIQTQAQKYQWSEWDADVRALASIGRPAVPALLQLAKSDDVRDRKNCARLLGMMAPTEEVQAAIRGMLDGQEYVVRAAAARGLWDEGDPAAVATMASLLTPWRNVEYSIREEGDFDYLDYDREYLELIDLFGEPYPSLAPGVPALVDVIENRGAVPQARAAYSLAQMGTLARGAAPALLRAWEETNYEWVRYPMSLALVQIGADSPVLMPQMIENLIAGDVDQRLAAAYVIAHQGVRAERAIPILRTLLSAEELPVVRAAAAGTLGQIGAAARPALAELDGMLTDSDPLVRVQAAWALWRIDRRTDVIATLIEAIERRPSSIVDPEHDYLRLLHRDAVIQFLAVAAVADMGEAAAPAVHALGKLYLWEHCVYGEEIENTLIGLGPKAAPTVPRLVEMLDVLRFRRYRLDRTLRVLRAIGPAAAPAAPALTRWLRAYRVTEVDPVLIDALASLGPGARESAQPLRAIQLVGEPEANMAAAHALWRIEHDSAALTSLVAGLKSGSPAARSCAAYYLGEIQAPGETMVAPLTAALADPDDVVRTAAARSLLKMNGSPRARAVLDVTHRDGGYPASTAAALALWLHDRGQGGPAPVTVKHLADICRKEKTALRMQAEEALLRGREYDGGDKMTIEEFGGSLLAVDRPLEFYRGLTEYRFGEVDPEAHRDFRGELPEPQPTASRHTRAHRLPGQFPRRPQPRQQ